MSQFEYTVPLSPIKPEDIERVAKEYLEKKMRETEDKQDDQVRI